MPKEGTLDLLVAFGVVSVSTFSTLALFVAKSPVGFVVCGAVAVLFGCAASLRQYTGCHQGPP